MIECEHKNPPRHLRQCILCLREKIEVLEATNKKLKRRIAEQKKVKTEEAKDD